VQHLRQQQQRLHTQRQICQGRAALAKASAQPNKKPPPCERGFFIVVVVAGRTTKQKLELVNYRNTVAVRLITRNFG